MHFRKTQGRDKARIACKALALAVAIAGVLPSPAIAKDPAVSSELMVSFSIPAGDLAMALEKFSTQSRTQVMYRDELIAGKKSRGLNDRLTPKDALERLLSGTSISIERVNEKTYVLKMAPARPSGASSSSSASKPRGKSTESEASEVNELERMVVVGSRLGVSPYDAMSMAKVIDRDEIEKSGASNIAQVLSNLSEVSVNNSGDSSTGSVAGNLGGSAIGFSTVQLRGLPQGTTLVLINGRRAGGSAAGYNSDLFDLSTIPLAMVERIEVLPMGASAVYGGDGLAGVVNIVLRRDADGIEFQGRRMAAEGYAETNGGITFGKTFSNGRLMATATWRRTGTLSSDERALMADENYNRYGGRDFRQPTAYPGNVYSMAGCGPRGQYGYSCFVPIGSRGNLPGLSSPFASVPAGQNGVGLSPQDFAESQGTLNLATGEYNITSPTQQIGVGFNGSLELSGNAEIFAELNLTKRKVDAIELDLILGSGLSGANSSVVSATNPYNPFGVDVGVNYRFDKTGLYRKYSQTYWRGLLGIRGETSGWGWELTAWQSRDWSDTGDVGYFNSDLVAASLASSDPSQALNPFTGDGSPPASQELLRKLAPHVSDGFSTTVQGINGFVRRSFTIPSGTATALIGAEYERTLLDARPWATALSSIDGKDDRQAVFTEARAPIIPGDGGNRSLLALSAAARYEATGRAQGNAFTNSIGLEYSPLKTISFLANYSTAFKPITLSEASLGQQVYQSTITDPALNGARYRVNLILSGGTPVGLRPETGENYNFAVIYAPSQFTRISATHWINKLRDRFSYIGASGILANEDIFSQRVTRDAATGQVTFIDARPVNIAWTDTAGIDLSAASTWTTRFGDFDPSISATYFYKYEEKLSPTSTLDNRLGRLASSGWSPRWKIVPKVTWNWRDVSSATLTGRYVSSYVDPAPFSTGEMAGSTQKLGDFWQFDLNWNVDVTKWISQTSTGQTQARLSLGALNLLNQQPKFCNYCANNGWKAYDAKQYDIVGRRLYAELKLSF